MVVRRTLKQQLKHLLLFSCQKINVDQFSAKSNMSLQIWRSIDRLIVIAKFKRFAPLFDQLPNFVFS